MISPHLLRLEASYSYTTYGGCYEGPPSPKSCIEQARQQAEKLWGKHRPVLVIEPTVKSKMLSKWTHLVSGLGPAMDDDNDGSHLIVIWWSEMSPDTNRVLASVDWESHAKDYQI
jgi:hypothetical protein